MSSTSRRRAHAPLRGRPRRRVRPRSGEKGFIAVTTAIMMTLLLMCAALALDVAVWFSRAAELQRTADAASLAGVVRMPDFANASAIAQEIATKNKVRLSAVTVATVPNSPRQLKVTIAEPNVRSFFGKLVNNGIPLQRSAIAEYVPKIELGSALNAIGTGDLPGWEPSGGTQDFWLAINGKCTAREDGDRYASAFDGNRKIDGTVWCDNSGAIDNADYRAESVTATTNEPTYSYIVDVPCPTTGLTPCPVDVKVEVYNPMFDNSNEAGVIDTNVIDPVGTSAGQFTWANFVTLFRLRDLDGNTVSPYAVPFGTCNQCQSANNQWYSLFTITQAGQYRVDVSTEDNPYAYGSNAFSLRAYHQSAGAVLCTGTTCPTIAGQASMGVYANVSSGQADFFLAKLSPARYYRGKKVQVQLFDPGEGARSIQILQPTGGGYVPFTFRYQTWTPGLVGYPTDTGFPLATTNELDVDQLASSLTSSQKAPWWGTNPPANDSIFNGRVVSLELQIPSGYGCVANAIPCVEDPLPQDGWWKIRYNTNTGVVSDRTTWSVRMFGDPVHLIQQ
jgi:Putative Flp pilus-assembly TadE/G-like